jgi:hypothetical protein
MLTLAPKDALELPADELALLVLADLVTSNEWNDYNYGNRYRKDVKGGYSADADARRAISEAMGWLRSHGMIGRKTEDNNPDSIFVTRWVTKLSPRAWPRFGPWTESRTISARSSNNGSGVSSCSACTSRPSSWP